jgi:hypothetical protein
MLQTQSFSQDGTYNLSGLEKLQPLKSLLLPSFNDMKPAWLSHLPVRMVEIEELPGKRNERTIMRNRTGRNGVIR